MKIAIDLRCLASGSISGVENYTNNLVEALLSTDKKNQYILFATGLKKPNFEKFRYTNVKLKHIKMPNKILNLLLMFKLVSFEKFLGDFDLLYMPNLNQFNIKSKTKLVITVHDLSPVLAPEFYDFKRRLWHFLLRYKKSFVRADLIFAVSETTKKDLIRYFKLPENKIKVCFGAINFEEHLKEISPEQLREIRNRYNLPGKFILFLNTIEPRKNLTNLIQAFGQVNDPDSWLVVAGKIGWKHKSAFKAIANSPKKSRIIRLGYIPESEKLGLIKLSKILIYPSFYEGFGFQLLEAMAQGVAVAAAQAAALPEISGGAALLFNPHSPEDIAEALKTLLNDSALQNILVARGKNRIKDFSWGDSASLVLSEFAKI